MIDFMDGMLVLSRCLIGFRVILNPLISPFTVFERQIIFEVRQFIDEKFIDVFDEHFSCINYVQRDGGFRIIRLYQWAPVCHYNWVRRRYFEPATGINKLVRFTVKFQDDSIINGAIVSIDGVICNISFSKDVEQYKNLNNFSVKIKKGVRLRFPQDNGRIN